VIRGDCLLLVGGGDVAFPVWPVSTSFRPEPGGGAVLDEKGRELVRVGERIRNGGETASGYPREDVEAMVGQRLPARCGNAPITDDDILLIGQVYPPNEA